jgi:crossover junction endodeoxyribonuclease RusA
MALIEKDLPRKKPKSVNKQLKVSLPVPPSVNAIYYNTRGGGRRLTKKAEHYIRDTRALTNQAMDDQHWTTQDKGVWLYIDMVYYFPDRRRRDSHNCLKILLDALESLVYTDDMYVMPRIQSVEYDKENPRVELSITVQTKNNREKGLKTTQIMV